MSSRNKPVTALLYQMLGEAHTKALEELFHCCLCIVHQPQANELTDAMNEHISRRRGA